MDFSRILYSEISFRPAKSCLTSTTSSLVTNNNNIHHNKFINGARSNNNTNGFNIKNNDNNTTHNGAKITINGNNNEVDSNNEEFKTPKHVLSNPSLVKLSWTQAEKVGGGLINVGNTCFLNSVLQCLTYCPPLYNFLVKLNGGHSSSCKINQSFCMLCEMEKHVKRVRSSNGSSIKPISIVQRLKYINRNFQFGRQEDAHEFLRYLIDHMWKACLMNLDINTKSNKLDPRIKETTIINHIFGGYHRSQVLCLTCNSPSNTFDFFMDFILDIRNAKSLEEALKRFTQPETLENENAYKCGKCRKKVTAKKKFTVYKAPNVATFQLKRFDSDRIFGGKITKFISYPDELDLRPYMSDTTKSSIKYQLSSVLVHVGSSSNSGHYFCFIKNSNNFWYRMDDSNVSLVSQSTVLQQQAYVLFYTRKSGDLKNPSNGISRESINTSSTPTTVKNFTSNITSNGTNHLNGTSSSSSSPSTSTTTASSTLYTASKTSQQVNGGPKITNYFTSISKNHSQPQNLNSRESASNIASNGNGTSTSSDNGYTSQTNGFSTTKNSIDTTIDPNNDEQTQVLKSVQNSNGSPSKLQINNSKYPNNIVKTDNTRPLTSLTTWFGERSKLDEEDSNKRKLNDMTDRDRFNEELDQGKLKKIKNRSTEDRFSSLSKTNLFQRFTGNGYQQYHSKKDTFQKHSGRQYNHDNKSNGFSHHGHARSNNNNSFRRYTKNKFRHNGKHKGRNFNRRQKPDY